MCDLISLKRKDKEPEAYFLLYNGRFMSEDQMREIYVLCFGYPFQGTSSDLVHWVAKCGFKARVYSSHRMSVQNFLDTGQFDLAREFVIKEYEDSGMALDIFESQLNPKMLQS